jgi:hypothetical protein
VYVRVCGTYLCAAVSVGFDPVLYQEDLSQPHTQSFVGFLHLQTGDHLYPHVTHQVLTLKHTTWYINTQQPDNLRYAFF